MTEDGRREDDEPIVDKSRGRESNDSWPEDVFVSTDEQSTWKAIWVMVAPWNSSTG